MRSMNILQMALLHNFSNMVQYIMSDHKVLTSSKQTPKSVDPRLLVLGTDTDEDETLTIRLAIMNNNLFNFVSLWSTYGFLYTEEHMLVITRYLLSKGHQFGSLIEAFIASETTKRLYQGATPAVRNQFRELLTQEFITENVKAMMVQSSPYREDLVTLDEDEMNQPYLIIRTNNASGLQLFVAAKQISSLANVFLDMFEDE